MDYSGTWKESLTLLERKLGSQVTESWFKPVVLSDISDSSVRLEAPNRFFKEWIEEHHNHTIDDIVALAPNVELFYVEVGVAFTADAAMRKLAEEVKILKQNQTPSSVSEANSSS